MMTANEISSLGRPDWLTRHLGQVPPLILHIREQALPSMQGSAEPRVSGSKEKAIAPLSIDPIDDADALWAAVCALVIDHAERTKVNPPEILKRQWIVQGSVARVHGFATTDTNTIYSDVVAVVRHLKAHAWPLAINQEYRVPVDELVELIVSARRKYPDAPSFSPHRHQCPRCLQYSVVPEYSPSGEIRALVCKSCPARRDFE